MQAVKGLLNDGRFIPHDTIRLPQIAEVTLLFREAVKDNEKEFWAEFDRKTAESANENDLLSDEAFARRGSGRAFIDFSDEGGVQ